MKKNQKRIFLDFSASTPIDRKVEKYIQKIQKNFWANPSSLHLEGEAAKNVIEESRMKIARILHCRAEEIYFTSSGTEALNIAILGAVEANRRKLKEEKIERLPHIITSTIEHSAVLNPVEYLIKSGKAEASFIAPDSNGILSPDSIKNEIKENTVLVAIQQANSEVGTVQPLREIRKALNLVSRSSPLPEGNTGIEKNGTPDGTYPKLLVDACQAPLYLDVSVERLGADMLVIDGIKTYGPRGVGALFIKRDAQVRPVFFGGGQERGLRPGTQNTPSIAGLALALEIASKMREKECKRLEKIRDYAIGKILKEIPGTSLNGSLQNRLPNNLNICFRGQDSEFLVIKLDTLGFAVSAASACRAISQENSSYVVESISGKECAKSSLRFTLGRQTTRHDLDKLISTLKRIIK